MDVIDQKEKTMNLSNLKYALTWHTGLLQQVINQLSVQHEKRANIEIATYGLN